MIPGMIVEDHSLVTEPAKVVSAVVIAVTRADDFKDTIVAHLPESPGRLPGP